MDDDIRIIEAVEPLQAAVSNDVGFVAVVGREERFVVKLTPSLAVRSARQVAAAFLGPREAPPVGRVHAFAIAPGISPTADAVLELVMEDGRVIPIDLPIEYAPELARGLQRLVEAIPAAGTA